MKFLLYLFQIFLLNIIFIFNYNTSFAKEINYEIIPKPIEFQIFDKTFTSKTSVDNFLSNFNLSPNTLTELGLIKTQKGYQIIEGGKYFQTFHSESKNQSGYLYIVLFLFIIICLLALLCLYTVFRFKWKKA